MPSISVIFILLFVCYLYFSLTNCAPVFEFIAIFCIKVFPHKLAIKQKAVNTFLKYTNLILIKLLGGLGFNSLSNICI